MLIFLFNKQHDLGILMDNLLMIYTYPMLFKSIAKLRDPNVAAVLYSPK